jgi:hypothetical protein
MVSVSVRRPCRRAWPLRPAPFASSCNAQAICAPSAPWSWGWRAQRVGLHLGRRSLGATVEQGRVAPFRQRAGRRGQHRRHPAQTRFERALLARRPTCVEDYERRFRALRAHREHHGRWRSASCCLPDADTGNPRALREQHQDAQGNRVDCAGSRRGLGRRGWRVRRDQTQGCYGCQKSTQRRSCRRGGL